MPLGWHLPAFLPTSGCKVLSSWGCISLHILYNVTVPVDSTVCESELPLVWNNVIFDYTSSEPLQGVLSLVDSATILASTGVDSTIVMTVTVNPTIYGTVDITVLEEAFPFNYNGEEFN